MFFHHFECVDFSTAAFADIRSPERTSKCTISIINARAHYAPHVGMTADFTSFLCTGSTMQLKFCVPKIITTQFDPRMGNMFSDPCSKSCAYLSPMSKTSLTSKLMLLWLLWPLLWSLRLVGYMYGSETNN